MAISIDDLPPKYREQAWKQIIEQDRRRKREATSPPSMSGGRRDSKYHNSPTERVTPAGTVIHFDSQREARRYDDLITRQKAGEIRNLRLQVDFTLQEAYTDTEGKRVRAIRYKADFTYELAVEWTRQDGPEHGVVRLKTEIEWMPVVEDVKSRATRTKEYLIKRKLMKERYGIDILEV